jgi:hypothetical protein
MMGAISDYSIAIIDFSKPSNSRPLAENLDTTAKKNTSELKLLLVERPSVGNSVVYTTHER